MIITITGDLGSGKSSVAKVLADKLNYKFLSTGSLFREYGKKKNMDVNELTAFAKTNREVDDYIDNILKKFNEDKYIIDSRMAWHFIKNSYKIFIKVDPTIAANRIMNDNRESEKYKDLNEALSYISNRKNEEDNRYKNLYDVEINNNDNYDLIIDSSNNSIEEIVNKIIENIRL